MAHSSLRSRQTGQSGKKQKATQPPAQKIPKEELFQEPWAPSTYTAFKAFLSARLCAAIWSNISDCDETYNYWEPTHFLIYGSGFQTWEYSPVYAIRSYAYILLHASVGWLYSRLLQTNKVLVFYFIRCLLGFSCALCEMYFYKGICLRFGNHVGRLVLAFLIFSAGMFISSSAYLPSSFTMYMIMLAMGGWFLKVYSVAIIGIAASTFVGWPFSAVLGIPIAIDILFIQRKFKLFLKWCIISFIIIAGLIIKIDSHYYGKFVFAPLNIVLYNVFTSHGPDLYGVEPWHFYFLNGFLNFNFVFVLSLLVGPVLILQRLLIKHSTHEEKWFSWLSVLPLYIWICIFYLQPHKEERFMFPIFPLFCLTGAIAFNSCQKLFYCVFLRNKLSHYLIATKFLAIFFIILTSVVSLTRIVALYKGYHAPFEIYMALGESVAEQNVKDPVNVCIGKEWHRFPSSFFLPEKWELQFIRSEFMGQLPAKYSSDKNAMLLIPKHMNDQNLEETSRYVNISHCHYLIDLDLPDVAPREPRYSLQNEQWKAFSSSPFLDAKRSHQFFRAFYIPFLYETHCQMVSYNLLKSRVNPLHMNRRAKRQRPVQN